MYIFTNQAHIRASTNIDISQCTMANQTQQTMVEQTLMAWILQQKNIFNVCYNTIQTNMSSSTLHSVLKLQSGRMITTEGSNLHTCFQCKQTFTTSYQCNAHQRFCLSVVKSDRSGKQLLEAISTMFTQSSLAKTWNMGTLHIHTHFKWVIHNSQLHHYLSFAQF